MLRHAPAAVSGMRLAQDQRYEDGVKVKTLAYLIVSVAFITSSSGTVISTLVQNPDAAIVAPAAPPVGVGSVIVTE